MKPTSDYSADCDTGGDYAVELRRAAAFQPGQQLFDLPGQMVGQPGEHVLPLCLLLGVDDPHHPNEPVLAIPFSTPRPTIYTCRGVAPDDIDAYVLW